MLANLLIFLLLFSANSFAAGEGLSAKGLEHRVDVVILKGSALASLVGAENGSIHVYAVDARGELEQIPFQIDEKFPGGDFVLTPNKLEGTGVFSSEDELSFMARDSGARIRAQEFSLSSQIVKEIELTDPQNGQKGFVYVAWNTIPPLRLPVQYIQYNAAESSIMGGSYFVSFDLAGKSPDKMCWQENHLSMAWNQESESNSSASASREVFFTPNLLKRGFLDVQLVSIGDMFKWNLKIKDLNATEVGQLAGPIRAVRKIRLHPKLGYGIKIKPVTVVQYFYDQYVTTEVDGDLQNMFAQLFSQIQVTFGEEFADSFAPALSFPRFEDRNLLELTVSEQGTRQAKSYWRIESSEAMAKAIGFLVQEAKDASCAKCLILEINGKKLPAGPLHFAINRYFPKSHSPEELKAFLAMGDQPLQVKVSTVSQNLVLQQFSR